MLKNSLLVKEFSYEDDATVDFSVDPLMYEKLGIKKQKKGMESVFDLEKIKDFQVKKDCEKIKKVKGGFKKRNQLYMDIRKTDPYYRVVAQGKKLGRNAQFVDLLPYTVDASWRATCQPYGVIAEKRYQEYLANLPKGPSLEEVEDKLQRRTDHQLYRKIITGVLEPTRAEIRAAEIKAAEEAELAELAEQVVDIHKEERERMQLIKEERFSELRKLPTLRQHKASMKEWHKGIHYPYEDEKGFPIVARDDSGIAAGSTIIPELRGWESFTEEKKYKGDKYTHGEKLANKEYLRRLAALNYDLAVKFLEENRIQKELEAKKLAENKDYVDKSKRRVGAGSTNIRDVLAQVKYEQVKELTAFTTPAPDAIVDSSSDDESSSEDEEEQKKSESSKDKSNTINNSTKDNSKASVILSEKGTSSRLSSVKINKRKRPLTCSERMFRLCASKNAVAPFDSLEEMEEDVRSDTDEPARTSLYDHIVRVHQRFIASLISFRRATIRVTTSARSRLQLCWERLDEWRTSGHFETEKVKKKNYDAINMRHKLEDAEEQLRSGTKQEMYLNPNIPEEKVADLVPQKEFYDIVKMKRHQIKREMKELKKKNKVMTRVDRRAYNGLQRRLDAIQATVDERKAIDQIEINKDEKIKEYLSDYKHELEAEIERKKNTRLYKTMHWYSNYKARKRRERAEELAKKRAGYKLKPYDPDENQTLMELLVTLRIKEKELEQRASVWIARFMCTTYKPPVREYTVDDLILACNSGRYKEVLDIVTSPIYYVGPNEVNTDGVTATYSTLMMILQNAVMEDDRNYELLVYSKYQRMKQKYSPFVKKKVIAAQLEYVLQILLNQGGDVEYKSQESGKDGVTVLHNAADVGGNDMITWLLDKGVSPNTLTSKLKKTPLMCAVENNQLDTVMLLLKRGGMDLINHQDVEGWSALHYATIKASNELVKVLLICGAKSSLRNSAGRYPQEEAVNRGKVDMNLLIMSHRSIIVDHLTRLDFLDDELYSRYTTFAQKGRTMEDFEEEAQGEDESKTEDFGRNTRFNAGSVKIPELTAEEQLVERETTAETNMRHAFNDFDAGGA